jgi:acetyl esterase/lipase
VADLRADMERLAGAMPVGDGVGHESVTINGLPAEWTRASLSGGAAAPTDAAILHFHGGGYVIGSPLTTRTVTAGLARHTGLPVLAPDYRLAPEHPFPAAVDDTVTAYQALLAQGFAPNRVIVSGDSAGGGLAMALLLCLRDRGLPLPAGAVGISPLLDLTLSSPSIDANEAKDPQVTRAFLELVTVANYLPADADPKAPLASPLFADLAGLPPLLVHVGGDESLLDDSVRFGEAADSAGVDCTVEVWEAMVHVWHQFSPRLPEAEAAHASIAAWVRTRFDLG